jgi:hypothetical protein
MQRVNCPVAVDYFSLSAGDGLRASIERGLKEYGKCILVITPNFLGHGGWAKKEYDKIITHELVEVQKAILPVLHTVDMKELREYSPILANHVNLRWSMGVDYVAQKLKTAIQAR